MIAYFLDSLRKIIL